MPRSVRAQRRDARREHRKKVKRREIRRMQNIADRWNEGDMIVFVGPPLVQLGPSTFYCPDCGILEPVREKEDEAPCYEGAPSMTNFQGVRNDHLN